MSLPKPHRRLDLTRPSAGSSRPVPEDETTRLARLEARCARLEALLARQAESGPPFRVADGAGRTLLDVDADSTGATLQLLDAEGEPTAVLSVEAAGGALTLLNSSGCVIGAVVLHPARGRVVVRDEAGNPAVILETSRPGGGLEVRMFAEDEATAGAGGSDLVPVLDTGGELSHGTSTPPLAASLRSDRGLDSYSLGGRKAVALYAEGMRGPVRVYDQAGACVFSRD